MRYRAGAVVLLGVFGLAAATVGASQAERPGVVQSTLPAAAEAPLPVAEARQLAEDCVAHSTAIAFDRDYRGESARAAVEEEVPAFLHLEGTESAEFVPLERVGDRVRYLVTVNRRAVAVADVVDRPGESGVTTLYDCQRPARGRR